MSANTPVGQPDGKREITRGVVRRRVQVGAAILVQAAFRFISTGHLEWAMVWNKFFSTTVASGGPYRYTRHPGYEGHILTALATPLILSSLRALIPAGLTALMTVGHRALEEKALLEKAHSSTDYVRRVRCRLLPGVWWEGTSGDGHDPIVQRTGGSRAVARGR